MSVITKEYLTRQFQNFNTDFLAKTYAGQSNLKIEKMTTPTESMLSSYRLVFINKNNEKVVLGDIVDIPKDYLVRSASIETCVEADVPVVGYEVGDKYIDFVINAKDDSGTPTHLYIAVKDLVNLTEGDAIELDGSSINVSYNDGLKVNTNNQLEVDFATTNIDYGTWNI